MASLFATDYRDCPKAGHAVCLRQTEQECRARNECADGNCPMAGRFTEAPATARSPEFSARIGLGTLAGRVGG